MVPGCESYSERLALRPEEFVCRWLESDDPRSEIIRELRAGGYPVPPVLTKPVSSVAFRIERSEARAPDEVRVFFWRLPHESSLGEGVL